MNEGSLHILLVEDNPSDADLLRETLAGIDEQLKITHLDRLERAVEYLRRAAPVDAILLDLGLPDSMGLPTLERANAAAPQLPILVLTGLEDEAIGVEAVRKGAQDYLVKGQTEPRVLVRMIRHAVARKRLEIEIQQAKEAAEAANVAKTQFLANVSHELRTPMNSIMGMTELALGEELTPTVRDYLKTAKESADVLLALLNEILDFSRMEAGKFQLDAAPFSLRQSVEQTMKSIGARAYEKGLELICDFPSEVPDALIGDRLRLHQVLMNLVGNAIKFTKQGEVVVRVEVQPQGGTERRQAEAPAPRGESPHPSSTVTLRFSVADTGIGIAPEHQDDIFAPFTQADASTTREFGGSGLGLAISSSLISLMGGRLWVESQPGRGSTFYFTAQFELQPAPAAESREIFSEREQLRGLSVLVVAESFTTRRILEQTLVHWKMHTEAVNDVPTALAKIHEAASAGRPFAVAIIDALLPQIDGFTLTSWIKNDPRLVGTAILMVSACDRPKYARRCQDLGIRCLEKPISQSNLFDALAQTAGHGTTCDASLSETVSSDSAPRSDVQPSIAPGRTLRILLAEDNPANQKVAIRILSKQGHVVAVANNGREAVERAKREDFDLVLMDVQMPTLDGFQATAAIRKLADPQKARVPIVAMTAHATKGDRARCLGAGMDGYLSKPINARDLLETIGCVLDPVLSRSQSDASAAHGQAAAATAAEALDGSDATPAAAPAAVFSMEQALTTLGGETGLFRSMVAHFFDDWPRTHAAIQAGLEDQDARAVARAAHRLKGTLLHLGAEPALEAVNRVEKSGSAGDLAASAADFQRLAHEIDRLSQALTPHRPDQ